jgi:tetratricopeptide (TPR) repeat protein
MKTMSGLLLGLGFAALAHAQSANNGALVRMQTRWAEINYQMQGKAQTNAFEQLLDEADTFVQQHPDDADMLIWDGIIKSSYAGASGGLGGLKYAKAAKADFEKSIEINPAALSGSAYTSLGTLYFKVPGWPLGFGDDKRAEQLLRKAVEINPSGIDPNYFLGEYLRDQHRYAEAVQYYRQALLAPARPGRELADRERRREVQIALDATEKQLQ